MQIANSPLKWTIAFANGDTGRVEVPATTADPTRASLTLGFPPLTRVPPEDGGVPPLGEDFNGAMNQVARIALWNMAGGVFSYDATFANDTNVSGYPQGAVLASTDFSGAWTTTVDNNAVDPDTTGTNWVPVYAYGVLALTGQTGGTTTLTPVQAMKKTITIAGALTSNLTVVVPAWTYNWQVSNLTTGAFTVTVKTAAGSGTIIPQTGTPTPVTGDGTNVASADYLRADLASSSAGKGTSLIGYLGGLLKTFLDNLSAAGAATGAAMLAFIHNGTGAVGRLLQDKTRETARSPQDYGAKGDMITVTGNASITSGAAALTVVGAAFTAADVGKAITVPGAGAAGGVLVTTIIGYTSATQVTLGANAGTTLAAVSSIVLYGTDDTAAFQAWVTACATFGYKGNVPAVSIGYFLTAPVTTNRGIQIEGEGCEPYTTSITTVGTRGRGSWLYLAHTGLGLDFYNAATVASGAVVRSIGTFRNQPAPNGGAFTPYANDYDFRSYNTDLFLDDVCTLNPTKAVTMVAGNYGRLTTNRLRGQPLQIGINVDKAADVCRFDNNHFWTFWSNDAGVRTYMANNAIANSLYRCDNPTANGCFSIGYARHWQINQNADGTTSKLRMVNCDGDLGGYFLEITSGVTGATVQMTNCCTQGSTAGGLTAYDNINIAGASCFVQLANIEVKDPQSSNIAVTGANNTVIVSNLTMSNWNRAGTSSPGINVTGSGSIVKIDKLPMFQIQTGTSAVFAGAVKCPLQTAAVLATTDGAGRASINHNLGIIPNVFVMSSFGTARQVLAVSSTSTSMVVEIRTSAGVLVASTPNIPVHYELSF